MMARTPIPTVALVRLSRAGLRLSARLTYIGMAALAEGDDICAADPELLKRVLWRYDQHQPEDVADDLGRLEAAGLIACFEDAGAPLAQILRPWNTDRISDRTTDHTPTSHAASTGPEVTR